MPDTKNKIPNTRGDCINGARPCPHITCKYHLYNDVSEYCQSIATPAPMLCNMCETCALDIAEEGGMSTQQVANLIGVSEWFVRYACNKGMKKMAKRMDHIKGD